MPLNTSNNSAAGTIVGEMHETLLSLQQSQAINVEELMLIIKKTKSLFKTMRMVLPILSDQAINNNAVEDLVDSMSSVITNLGKCLDNKQHPPSPMLLNQITRSLDDFANKIVTKDNRTKVRKALSYVGIAESVLFYCGNIPYFWTEASPMQKVTLILGAALVVASVGLTIAAFANPAVGAAVGGGFGIMLIAALGIFMYRFTLEHVRPKSEEKRKVDKALKDIQKLQTDFNDFITKQLPEYKPKDNLVYSLLDSNAVQHADENKSTDSKAKQPSKLKLNRSAAKKEKED